MESRAEGETGGRGPGAAFIAGLLIGVLLDPAPDGRTARLALALLGVACAGRARWPVAALAVGVAAGAAAALLAPVTDAALTPLRGWTAGDVAVGLALLVVATGGRRTRAGALARAWRVRPTWRGCASVLAESVAALAASAALAATLTIAFRVTAGETGDHVVATVVLAALVAAGAALLGGSLRRVGPAAAPAGLAAASCASLACLPLLAGATSPDGFASLCARIGRSPAAFGTPAVDALLVATVAAAPALLVGAALAGAAEGARLARLLAAGCVGAWCVDRLLAVDAATLEGAAASLGGAGVVARAAALGGGALLLAAFATVGSTARRAALGAAGVALCVAGLATPLSPIRPPIPWQRFPAAPLVVFEAPSGQYAIEPSGSGGVRVRRDHATITPGPGEDDLERAQIEAWAAARGGYEASRVVLLGLATPSRASALAAAGVEEFDRTGVPAAIGRLLERRLFEGHSAAPPPGDFVADPRRIDLAFRVGARELAGPGGLLAPGLDAPHAVQVSATHAGAPADGSWAIAGSDGLRGFWLERSGALALRRGGAPSVLARLGTPVRERERAALRALFERARPAAGDPLAAFHDALARFADAQRISSPFESPDERVELDADFLAALGDHVVARPPGALTALERSVVEGAASALVAQREVPWILAHLGPIADAHAPWPRVVLALCVADEEELRPADAAARRARLLEGR